MIAEGLIQGRHFREVVSYIHIYLHVQGHSTEQICMGFKTTNVKNCTDNQYLFFFVKQI